MPTLGVVIPTLNEAANISGILSDIGELRVPVEVIVVDGGSEDGTVDAARSRGAKVLSAERGRGNQLAIGAMDVGGEWLCFVHADVRMPGPARTCLEQFVSHPTAGAAVWRLAIDASGAWLRVVEFGARLRDLLGGLPYGDQGLVVRRTLYESVGGFRAIPIMEDVAMVRALRRLGTVERLDAPLVVSPRRWLREGQFRTWARNICLLGAFLAGVSPRRLAKWYRPEPR